MLPPGQLLDETEGDDPQVQDELNGVVAPELAGMTEPETDLSHAGGRRTDLPGSGNSGQPIRPTRFRASSASLRFSSKIDFRRSSATPR